MVKPQQLPLYGDYELLIDHCLNGDPDIKRKVAEADANRRGFAVLQYHLNKANAHIPTEVTNVYRSCQMDQAYYADLTSEQIGMRGIDLHRGKYRVRVTVEHNRYTKTFSNLIEAKQWRDRMVELGTLLD